MDKVLQHLDVEYHAGEMQIADQNVTLEIFTYVSEELVILHSFM